MRLQSQPRTTPKHETILGDRSVSCQRRHTSSGVAAAHVVKKALWDHSPMWDAPVHATSEAQAMTALPTTPGGRSLLARRGITRLGVADAGRDGFGTRTHRAARPRRSSPAPRWLRAFYASHHESEVAIPSAEATLNQVRGRRCALAATDFSDSSNGSQVAGATGSPCSGRVAGRYVEHSRPRMVR